MNDTTPKPATKEEIAAACLRAVDRLHPLHPGKDALIALAAELTEKKS